MHVIRRIDAFPIVYAEPNYGGRERYITLVRIETRDGIVGDERVEIGHFLSHRAPAGDGRDAQVALEQDRGAVRACIELLAELRRHRGSLKTNPQELTDVIAHARRLTPPRNTQRATQVI